MTAGRREGGRAGREPPPALPVSRPSMRTGFGYDSHRLVAGRPLILAGQRIPFELGLTGHSDADIVAHALTDAILGGAAAGNIGSLFPDSDPRWKDADSMALLRQAHEQVRRRGYRAVQADITILAERPRLAPYLAAMAAALTATLELERDAVSVKAKTNEGMGFTGRGEGMAAFAVATLEAVP